ncbi:MAG: PAS domain-containing protein [Candidatus Eisenbacteria bacterium]|nr:PAS domain-containing protein [Candidatus Eisenbacteria bacterium]
MDVLRQDRFRGSSGQAQLVGGASSRGRECPRIGAIDLDTRASRHYHDRVHGWAVRARLRTRIAASQSGSLQAVVVAQFPGPHALPWLAGSVGLGVLAGWLIFRGRRRRLLGADSDVLRSKRQLQAIFDGITDGLIIVDRDFRIVAVNKAEASFLGREPKELVGRPCYEVYCRGDRACELCPAHETFAQGKPSMVSRLELTSGYHRTGVDVYTFPVKDDRGETVQAIQYIKDVTDRVKLQKQLREVEQLTGIGQMAANVAHEIRNPLLAVGGFARQLHDEMEHDDPRREYTGIILEEVTRLEQILREQLTLERHLVPSLAPVDINQILRDVRKLLSHGILSSQVRLVGELAPGLPETMGDANQLKQAFLNIINNSIQAMPEGGTIEVTTTQKGGSIVVGIEDTGPGIPGDVMNKLFVPFFTTRQSGSGLGLAVTKRIIDNHGGDIEVMSEVGKGTRFDVSIPIVRSTSETEQKKVYGAEKAADAGGGE